MRGPDLAVLIRRLDGQWEPLPTGNDYGVLPETVDLSSNKDGPDRATFTLNRDPERPRLDLAHDTPIEFEVGGELVWDGRIMEAPAGKNISVSCEGYQYAEDDHTYTQRFVHHDLSDWKDLRSVLTARLGGGALTAYFQVNQEDGALTILIPKGTVVAAGEYGGFYLDAGPEAVWRSGGIEYETSNNAPGGAPALYLRGHTRPDDTGWTDGDIISGEAVTSLGAKGMRSGGIRNTAGTRYLLLFLYVTAGATTTADLWVKVKAARVTSATTDAYNGPGAPTTDAAAEPARGYVMGAKSRLRADHVIVDAFSHLPMLTSPGTFESASFKDEVLGTEELYAYYRFQEAAGATQALDASGNLRHATITGAVTLAQARLLAADPADPDPASGAQAIQFTANTNAQHVDVPTFDPSESGLTVEAVFKTPLGGTDLLTLFSIGDASAANRHLALAVKVADGKLYWGDLLTAGSVVSTAAALTAGRTYYVIAGYHPSAGVCMLVYDITTGTLTPLRSTGTFAWAGSATPTIQVGNFTLRNNTSGLIGTIDELAIYRQFLFNPDTRGGPTVTVSDDARRRALSALKREAGDIKRGGFTIPNLDLLGKSPREALAAANAMHGYQAQVLPGATWRYRALPSVPVVKTGDWEGSDFNDTSNLSGRDVINSAKVMGADPAGNPILAIYNTLDLPDAIIGQGRFPQPANPSFDVDLSNWTNPGALGTLTRDTGTPDSAPASMRLNAAAPSGVGPAPTTSVFTGPFVIGLGYMASLRLYSAVTWPFGGAVVNITDLATGQLLLSETIPTPATGAWFTYTTRAFRPVGTTVQITVNFNAGVWGSGQTIGYLDTVRTLGSIYTLLDRQGGFRQKTMTPTQPITQVIANQLAKILLLSNMTTPFKGEMALDDGGARGYRDDLSMPAYRSLLLPGELVHIGDRSDPDKGSLGRDGRVVSASWNYKTGTAKLALDNEVGQMDQILARYGARIS